MRFTEFKKPDALQLTEQQQIVLDYCQGNITKEHAVQLLSKEIVTEAPSSFGQAFAQARKAHGGPGGVFTWKGKKYQTNIKGEKYVKNPTPVGQPKAKAEPKKFKVPPPDLNPDRIPDKDVGLKMAPKPEYNFLKNTDPPKKSGRSPNKDGLDKFMDKFQTFFGLGGNKQSNSANRALMKNKDTDPEIVKMPANKDTDPEIVKGPAKLGRGSGKLMNTPAKLGSMGGKGMNTPDKIGRKSGTAMNI